VQALRSKIGYWKLKIQWKRIKWNSALANKFRYGQQTSEYADLVGIKYKLVNEINIGYKYFDEKSCTLDEGSLKKGKGCIDGPGWRQLLRFTSSSVNIGKKVLHLGDVFNQEYLTRGVFEYDPCHMHYHFQHYENYLFGLNTPGRKTGFCLQTTWRYHNNEWTDFNTPYSFCSHQGISVGWGDDYYAGLDCQWIDVTGQQAKKQMLKIALNPDNFLCEGTPILDKYKNYTWIATNFTFEGNKTVYRQACKFSSKYDKNNLEETEIDFKGKYSLVTLPCKRKGMLSPLKDCGFYIRYDNLICSPNETTQIKLFNPEKEIPAVVRLCETSKVLGHSTQCEFINNLANLIIRSNETRTVSFKCPNFRSSEEPGGLYSILVSNLIPNQAIPKILRV
jgi:hypothetical protein